MKKTTREIFEEELAKVPPEMCLWIDQSFELANTIYALMEQHNLSKMDMAKIFQVDEDTVAWWIGGTYNFDLETLAKISTYFNEPLITVNSK